MKSQLITLTILIMFSSLPSAFASESLGLAAKKQDIVVDTFNGAMDHIYYDCDYAKTQTKRILKTLGASDIKVTCTGGLDRFRRMPPRPLFLRTQFQALSSTGEGQYTAELQPFRFRYTDDCHLPATLFKALVPHFEFATVEYTKSCPHSRFASFRAEGSAAQIVE